jgi:hypothetical protein
MPKLKVEIEDKDYLFELDKAAIRKGELNGFSIRKVEDQPMNMTTLLWSIGLYKHHPNLPYEKSAKLFDKYADEGGDIAEVIQFLTEQYQSFSLATPEDSKKVKKAERID